MRASSQWMDGLRISRRRKKTELSRSLGTEFGCKLCMRSEYRVCIGVVCRIFVYVCILLVKKMVAKFYRFIGTL